LDWRSIALLRFAVIPFGAQLFRKIFPPRKILPSDEQRRPRAKGGPKLSEGQFVGKLAEICRGELQNCLGAGKEKGGEKREEEPTKSRRKTVIEKGRKQRKAK